MIDPRPSSPPALVGEAAGSFLLGLVGAFYNLRVLPQGSEGLDLSDVSPEGWYPYRRLIDTLESIQAAIPQSRSLLFQAGVQFLRIWYEQGPGKAMIHSSLDWLHANDASQGYNSVVRGGTPAEIGWCRCLGVDLAAGIARYESVMPLDPALVEGVFYGGCILFDDLDFVQVQSASAAYPQNPRFFNFIITVHFRLRRHAAAVDRFLAGLEEGPATALEPASVEALGWRLRGLEVKRQSDLEYHQEVNTVLARAIADGQAANAALAVARDAAEEASRTKSRFLASMSHELRTPLNAIIGFAQLLEHGGGLSDSVRGQVGIILSSGQHLLGLINDILDLAKVEAGKMTLDVVEVDLGGLIDEVIAMLRVRAAEKGLELRFDQTSSFPRFVRTDPTRVRQIIINLANNAIKFTHHGFVAIRLSTLGHRPLDRIPLLLEVRDTGPGISAEIQSRLFHPFAVGHHRAGVESTGLGLSITREIATCMGGAVSVESTLGHGSVFRVEIVCEPVAMNAIPSLVPRDQGIQAIEGAAACRILVVEDQAENRMLLHALLGPFGFQIHDAGNGVEALAAAAAWRPQLILMDRRMPMMDGLEATRAIVALGLTPPPIIIDCTAQTSRKERDEMLAAGCSAFIAKPYRHQDLLHLLASHLPIRLVLGRTAATKAQPLPELLATLPGGVRSAVREAATMGDVVLIESLLAPYPDVLLGARPDLDLYELEVFIAPS